MGSIFSDQCSSYPPVPNLVRAGGTRSSVTGGVRLFTGRAAQLAGLDLDAPRSRLFAPCNCQLQHAVLQVRIDLRRIEVRAQRERPREMRFAEFGVLQPQTGGCRHVRLGLDIEMAVVYLHIELVLRHAWQVRPQRDALAVLENVDGRRKRDQPGRLVTVVPGDRVLVALSNL